MPIIALLGLRTDRPISADAALPLARTVAVTGTARVGIAIITGFELRAHRPIAANHLGAGCRAVGIARSAGVNEAVVTDLVGLHPTIAAATDDSHTVTGAIVAFDPIPVVADLVNLKLAITAGPG